MLDYLNWYLVELEQRLRGRRSAQSTADFVLETRSHLEERVDDLVGKGMDRASAAKAAVADFGDPDSVVRAYSGSRPMSRRTLWAWIVVSGLLVGLIGGGFGSLAYQAVRAIVPSWAFILFWLPATAWLVTIVLSLRTREWVGPKIGAIAVGASILGGVWFASQTEILQLSSGSRFIYKPDIARDMADREGWLVAYEKDFKKVQEWRAARAAKDPRAESLLKILASRDRQYVGPIMAYWGRRSAYDMLPSNWSGPRSPWGPYVGSREPNIYMGSWGDFKYARDMWNQNGDSYAASLKTFKESTLLELMALQNIKTSSWWNRFSLASVPQIAAVVAFAVVATLLNASILVLFNLGRSYRRRVWRRQVG